MTDDVFIDLSYRVFGGRMARVHVISAQAWNDTAQRTMLLKDALTKLARPEGADLFIDAGFGVAPESRRSRWRMQVPAVECEATAADQIVYAVARARVAWDLFR